MPEIQELIANVNNIITVSQDKRSANSDRFNIFQVLNITTDEVRLHSKFLAELLNPKGTHDKGAVFLNRFLELTGTTGLFNPDSVTVTVEFQIGPVTPITGGRIDILIHDANSNALIIENKIYAGDQENQLLRYYNYAKTLENRGGKFRLLYLTLFEKNASEYSLGNDLKHEDYSKITYQETIVNWLEDCVLLVENTPKLAIAITHYLQLIKHLTNQDFSMKTKEEIIEAIIQNPQSLESSETIASNLHSAKKVLLRRVGNRLVEEIMKINGIYEVEISQDFGAQYQGIEIFTEDKRNSKNRPAHVRVSFLRETSCCYFEIHPGLKDGENLLKNHDKRIKYEKDLGFYFGKEKGKIMSTENYWHGEWVMEYYLFENRFADIILNPDEVVKNIMFDVKIVIENFIKVQSEF
jgi:hypothetical protein